MFKELKNHTIISGVILFAVFILLAVFRVGGPFALDIYVNKAISGTRSLGYVFLFMDGLSAFLSPTAIVIYSFIIALIIFLISKRGALWFLVVMLATFLAGVVFKELVGGVRPEGALVFADGNSFPSGHVLGSTVFLLLSAYILSGRKAPLVWVYYALAFIIIIAVSASRLYLGVHWMSDVFGGVILGFALVLLAIGARGSSI